MRFPWNFTALYFPDKRFGIWVILSFHRRKRTTTQVIRPPDLKTGVRSMRASPRAAWTKSRSDSFALRILQFRTCLFALLAEFFSVLPRNLLASYRVRGIKSCPDLLEYSLKRPEFNFSATFVKRQLVWFLSVEVFQVFHLFFFCYIWYSCI